MMVKVCGITNTEDAQAAVKCGAGALGFNFYPASPRYIQPEEAAGIIAGLPPSVCKVGVFVNAPPGEVARISRTAGLDVAQLHGDEPPGVVAQGMRGWKALRVDDSFTPARMEPYKVDAFVLDAPTEAYGGSGRTFDWSRARGTGRKIVLAGGLNESNVREAIRLVKPWGVDACSCLEIAPGRKDHARMQRFVGAALSEEVR